MQGWYCAETLMRQRPDRVQTESFDLVGSDQQGVASYEVIGWSTDHSYLLNADGNDLRWNSNPNLCQLANVTAWHRKNPEYLVVAAIRKLRTDKNCPAENHGQTMLIKNEQHIGSEKTYSPNSNKRVKNSFSHSGILFKLLIYCLQNSPEFKISRQWRPGL